MSEPSIPEGADSDFLADSFDETDVDAALERETDDGKGDDEVPDADFESYAAGENVTGYKEEN